MTQRELEEERAREQELLDRKWAREYEQRMKDYKPEVKLEYVDDTGRQLTTKEAYKQLSHVFHGNYSGKNKIDKVMQKRERERKQMSLTSSNATHQYGEVLESAHKKLGIAGIVLSTGNRTGLSKDIVKKNSSQP
ncbi:SART-1-domain-containing protein [Martensiomyces pterosporus]|nr:SART-1-domain-containing protein [Martensiomyces pterosporus]